MKSILQLPLYFPNKMQIIPFSEYSRIPRSLYSFFPCKIFYCHCCFICYNFVGTPLELKKKPLSIRMPFLSCYKHNIYSSNALLLSALKNLVPVSKRLLSGQTCVVFIDLAFSCSTIEPILDWTVLIVETR